MVLAIASGVGRRVLTRHCLTATAVITRGKQRANPLGRRVLPCVHGRHAEQEGSVIALPLLVAVGIKATHGVKLTIAVRHFTHHGAGSQVRSAKLALLASVDIENGRLKQGIRSVTGVVVFQRAQLIVRQV